MFLSFDITENNHLFYKELLIFKIVIIDKRIFIDLLTKIDVILDVSFNVKGAMELSQLFNTRVLCFEPVNW